MGFAATKMPACMVADTNGKLNAKSAAAIIAAALPMGGHVAGLIRYVSLSMPPSLGDITIAERDDILASCPLGLVQHVNNPEWVATNDNGKSHGAAAAAHAKLVEYPAGCHVGVDMEGIKDVGQPVLDYLKAWLDEAHAAGYLAVVYWGYAFQVAPADVVALLGPGDIFWTDYGSHAPPPGVGWTLKQHAQQMVGGTLVDLDDDVGVDGRGNALVMMTLAPENDVDVDPAAGGAQDAAADTIPIPSFAARDTQPPKQ